MYHRFVAFLLVVIVVCVFTLTRLGLMVFVGPGLLPADLWAMILFKGLWFDLLVASVLAAPVFLYEALLPERVRARAWHRGLRHVWLWAVLWTLLFCAVLEAAFWVEFSTRLNFIAVDYLLYTHEVIGNIRESYPVGWTFAGIGAVAALVVWLLRPVMRAIEMKPPSRAARLLLAALAIILPVLGFSLGSIAQMDDFGNAYAKELSGNGYFTFAAALRSNELDYDTFYRTIPQEEADLVLARLGVERTPLSAIVKTDMNDEATDLLPFQRRPRNVVLISVESLSASFVGAYGSTEGLTPNIDRLARLGLKFERVFATGTRTVRGLEALSLGTPPVPGQAIVRRPDNGRLSTIGEILKAQGLATMFVYGGYGYFDNMNAYFNANGYDIIDRSDFPEETVIFGNIWGVADEVLFSNAVRVIREAAAGNRPFFAHIMTTSNHRPYTYPAGRIDIPSPGGRSGAVKYSDYAIGQFIREAEGESWFRDTLFVITADHCASVAGETKLPVRKYHIPLVWYAPDIVAPGVFEPVISQIDLVPTLIEVLGMKGDDHFFGRSIFDDGPPRGQAFVSNYQELGYLRGGLLTVLLPKQRVESYRIAPDTYAQVPAPVDPERLREAVAYYQTASRAYKEGALNIEPVR